MAPWIGQVCKALQQILQEYRRAQQLYLRPLADNFNFRPVCKLQVKPCTHFSSKGERNEFMPDAADLQKSFGYCVG